LLRQVSRGSRQAVNRVVAAVECNVAAQQLPRLDLAVTFPDADRLRVVLRSDRRHRAPTGALAGLENIDAAAVSCFLALLWERSPMLVAKIRSLEISVDPKLVLDSIAGCVADFLARCASGWMAGRVQMLPLHLAHWPAQAVGTTHVDSLQSST
jgi:hypothetical protein